MILMAYSLIAMAQVGISTKNPLGIFYIDPNGDTSGVGINDSDDLVITHDGKVGIGTSDPQATLHVKGSMRYSDGTEGLSYVLRSKDALGNASWSKQRILNQIVLPDQPDLEAVVSNTAYNMKNNSPHYMGLRLTLPKAGVWKIFFKAVYRQICLGNKGYTLYWYLSTSSTTNTNAEKAISGYSGAAFNASRPIMLVSNCTFLITTTVDDTQIYLWANGTTSTMTTTEFNISYVPGDGLLFWALPMS